MDLIRLVCLFGWKKNAKEGVLVEVYVDGHQLSSGEDGIELVSNPAHRRWEMWWAANLEVPEGTVITLSTKVGVRGVGRDSDRTTSHRYVVRQDYPVREVQVRKVGFRGFPLLKGPVEIVLAQSLQDFTDKKIEAMLDEVGGED